MLPNYLFPGIAILLLCVLSYLRYRVSRLHGDLRKLVAMQDEAITQLNTLEARIYGEAR